MNLNPTCERCGRAKVWIGIGPGAEPECPKLCGACAYCRAPAENVVLVSATTEDRSKLEWLADMTALLPVTRKYTIVKTRCRKCGAVETKEKQR